MSDALLMDLADCRSPEALIATILKHHPAWNAFVPVEEFAKTVNIVDIKSLEIDAFEGVLITDEDKKKGVILVKEGGSSERRRFTIAHELGHFLIRSHEGFQQCSAADMRERRLGTEHQRREAEANRFAAGLLMPKPWFLRDLRRLGDADVSHVQILADRYQTSLEATINRFVDLTDDTCAFVFSRNGKIRYVRRTRDFPPMSIAAGDVLPLASMSARPLVGPLRVPSSWSELDGGIWLQSEHGTQSPRLLEQTLHQREGFQITMLFLNPDDVEEENEEQDLERSWEPHFRRR